MAVSNSTGSTRKTKKAASPAVTTESFDVIVSELEAITLKLSDASGALEAAGHSEENADAIAAVCVDSLYLQIERIEGVTRRVRALAMEGRS